MQGQFDKDGGAFAIVSSLQLRLVGALVLIAACIGAIQLSSHNNAAMVEHNSSELQRTAANAERARQLEDLVTEFRGAANIRLARAGYGDGQMDTVLTDIAIAIGEKVNELRLSGMPLYELQGGMMSFDELDVHIREIHDLRNAPQVSLDRLELIEQRNLEMVDLAALIAENAEREEAEAFSTLTRDASDWTLQILVGSCMAVGLIMLILFDLLRNILPSLSRMQNSLQRLADGDLNVELHQHSLKELRELSGALETFRRNAVSVKTLAFTDSSTGLPNRRALLENAGKVFSSCAKTDPHRTALMLADIDRFKHVNDDFGHAAGDLLVSLVGKRMQEVLGEKAEIARVGGDEFAVCLPLEPGQKAQATGSHLVETMREPFEMDGYSVAVTISLGTVEVACNDCDVDVNILLDRADLALYAAKNDGRNRAVGFTHALESEREQDRELERELSNASQNGQLRMVYQPIHAIGSDEQEVEALARWDHPELGNVSPARFIPVAERSGQMVQLGSWIIERSLSDLRQWPGLSLSLNLSPLQLQQDGFTAFLMAACRKNKILPQRLILEVTESLSIERNSRALLTLDLLRNSGFRIALDDFGTGYSSLSMMKTFQFDRLKLDRSLINDVEQNPAAKAVLDAAVTMALRIGAQVVAEGISEEELVEPVSIAGCTHLQGFHFSRPIEANEVAGYYGDRIQSERDAA